MFQSWRRDLNPEPVIYKTAAVVCGVLARAVLAAQAWWVVQLMPSSHGA
jgi:hypothetical protein